MRKAKQLLNLDDDDDGGLGSIRVNEDFARRFEHNKRREELHRLQEKHPELAARLTRQAAAEVRSSRPGAAGDDGGDEDDEDEESSSDDDDDEELDALDDTDKVLETLVKIKRQDPAIYNPEVVLFPEPEDGDEEDEQQGAAGRKAKPVYLRTVLAKQALEGAAVSSDDEEAGLEGVPRQPLSQSYAAEQQQLKAVFLAAAAEAETGGEEAGGLKAKKKKKQAAAAEGGGDEQQGAAGPDKGQQVNQLLEEYFGAEAEADPAAAFLKTYLATKAWKRPGDGSAPAAAAAGKKRLRMGDSSSEDEGGSGDEGEAAAGGDGAAADDDEDEQFLEEVDRFEAAYNFRYEEPGAAVIQSFPRVIENSVRRPDERRRKQREARAQRKAQEQAAREAELRRLKNLKKDEIQGMLQRIEEEAGITPGETTTSSKKQRRQAAGAGGGAAAPAGLAGLMDELLDGEWDPEEYDRRMAAAFGDDYYEGDDDPDELFGGREAELLSDEAELDGVAAATGLDLPATATASAARGDGDGDGGDGGGAAAAGAGGLGFAALRQKLQQLQEQEAAAAEAGDAAAGAVHAPAAEQRSQLQRLLDEYYKLDYEDNIGGLACRFRYREVPVESFGLDANDVLKLSDKQLNQVAGLKLIAPYRDGGRRLRPNYKALQSIKGEQAAAEAMKQQKKEREKQKEKRRKEAKAQQQQQQQQQPGEQQDEGLQQQQKQKQKGLQPQRQHKQQQQQQQGKPHLSQKPWLNKPQHHHNKHKQQQQQPGQQQQKPLSEMTAEEKQAARLASYAKLTLKPSKEQQQQQEGGSSKKRKAADDQQGAGGGSKKQKQQPAQPAGRLAQVPLPEGLTKAQRKNLIRSLKRKEKHQQ